MPAMLMALTIRGGMVLLAAFTLCAAMRRSSAALRHVVWTGAFGCMLALPALWNLAPAWKVRVPAATMTVLSEPPTTVAPSIVAAPRRVPDAPRFPWSEVWMAGMGLMVVRLGASFVRLSRLRARSRPAAWAGEAAVPVRESADVAVPITFGLLRPVILVPRGASNWPGGRLRAVLEHELAHVRRLDCLTQLLAEIVCSIYWFHPLAWLAAAQFRRERECACDDAVLNQGTKSSDYAEHLLGVVRSLNKKGAPAAMAISIHSHHLEERLNAVLKPGVNRSGVTLKAALAAVVVALCVALPIAAIRAQDAAARTANLNGTVYDASGAVVPFATVVATGLDTNNKEVAYGGAAGRYAFHSLPAGRYLVEVRVAGFAPFQRQETLGEGAGLEMDATMEVGGAMERVDVVARKPAGTAAPQGTPQRIRVGGNVQALKLISKVPPVYPQHAKENGVEGVVVLRGVVGTDGSVLSVETLSKSAEPELVQAARDAVSQWRYEPTLLNGEKVEVITTITVNFVLK